MTRPGELRDILLLLLLGLAWGGSFFLIKVAVETVPPFTVAATRLLLAAAFLTAIAFMQGHHLPTTARLWGIYLIVGLLGNAAPFILIGYGELTIDSGVAAILMASVPLSTMVMAHFLVAGERTNATKLTGIAVGIAGVLVLIGVDALAGLGAQLLGQLAVLSAAFSYALTNIYASRVRHMPAIANAAAALIGATIWSLPLSLIFDRPWALLPSPESLLAMLALALISTAAGTLLFFTLLRLAGPSFVSLTNFLVPVIGVFWGWLVLSERLGWEALIALILILTGIAIVRRGVGTR